MNKIKYMIYTIERFFERLEKNVANNLFVSVKTMKKEKSDIIYLLTKGSLLVANVCAFVGLILSYIIFVGKDGYQMQSGLVKSGYWESDVVVGQVPFKGAVALFMQYFWKVEIVLLVLIVLLAFVEYFKTESVIRKVLAAIALGYSCIFDFFIIGFIILANKDLEPIWNDKVSGILLRWGSIVFIIATVLAFILLIQSQSKRVLRNAGKTFFYALLVVPLILLMLEHIVSIFQLLLGVVVLVVMVKLFFGNKKENSEPTERDADSNDVNKYSVQEKQTVSNNKNSNADNYKNTSDKKEVTPAEKAIKKGSPYREGKNVYIPKYGKGGFLLYREKGVMDRVYWIFDRWSGVPNNICDYSALKSGAIHIYEAETGREIKYTEIGYAPKK